MTERDTQCSRCTRREALLDLVVLAAAPFAAVLAGCGSTSASDGSDAAVALDSPPSDSGATEPVDTALPPDTAEPPDVATPEDTEPPDAGPSECATNACIDLDDPKNAKLAAVGGTGQVTIGSDKVIVIHTEEATYVALSSVCTHKGCIVTFQKAATHLRCPCHGSVFQLDGSVTTGPAKMPLKVYTTELRDTVLIVYNG